MAQTLDWYFDFISPFAYFQATRLDEFKPYAQIHYKPVLFAGLLGHWGQKGPAEIPAKRRFTYRYAQWLAQQLKIDFIMPPAHPFNPLVLLRLSIAFNNNPKIINQIFRFVWAEGHDPNDLAKLQARLGQPERPPDHPEIKALLRQNTEQAATLGVFGVPTLVINKELFWGYDATDMALAYIQDPGSFNHPEMQRVSTLTEGVQRQLS